MDLVQECLRYKNVRRHTFYRKIFRYIILGQDTQFSFYAKIDKIFYEKNKEILMDIAMSLNLYEW